ncbi:hypothetical protein D3C86_1921310 [compost metagenome]
MTMGQPLQIMLYSAALERFFPEAKHQPGDDRADQHGKDKQQGIAGERSHEDTAMRCGNVEIPQLGQTTGNG